MTDAGFWYQDKRVLEGMLVNATSANMNELATGLRRVVIVATGEPLALDGNMCQAVSKH